MGWRKRGETDRRLPAEVFEQSEATAPDGGRELYIVCSSDKGLCGGIHSSVSKRAKAEFGKHGGAAASADSTEGPSIVVLGDKAKAQLSRTLGKNIAVSFNQVGKDVPTFAEASAIADKIVSSGIKFDKVCWPMLQSPLLFPGPLAHRILIRQVNIIYNAFVSAISFESRIMQVFSEESLEKARELMSPMATHSLVLA